MGQFCLVKVFVFTWNVPEFFFFSTLRLKMSIICGRSIQVWDHVYYVHP